MKRVLLTGLSGTGKSTLVGELAARGTRDLLWREDRIERVLATTEGDALFIAGCAPNQVKFYAHFDHIVLLSAPAEVIAARLATRVNNPYGKRADELTRTLALKNTVEPRLRSAAHLEIDASAPVPEVLSAVLGLLS